MMFNYVIEIYNNSWSYIYILDSFSKFESQNSCKNDGF